MTKEIAGPIMVRHKIGGHDVLLPAQAVVLPCVPRDGYASEADARADWYTLAPKHRTKKRLAEMLEYVRNQS